MPKLTPIIILIINNTDKENGFTSQMEQWSILSNIVNYAQYDRNLRNFHELDIKAIDQKNQREMYDRLKDEDRQVLQLDFGNNPDK